MQEENVPILLDTFGNKFFVLTRQRKPIVAIVYSSQEICSKNA